MAATVVVGAPAEGAFPGENGKLLLRSPEGNFFTVETDGSGLDQITDNAENVDRGLRWSADGSQFVFTRTLGNSNEIELFKMNSDGTGVQRLTDDDGAEAFPSWSPDGSKIVFGGAIASDPFTNQQIHDINADGSGERQLTDTGEGEATPEYSPDGTKIVFRSARDHNLGEIYVMDADGAGQTRLTENIVFDLKPTWSPDGSSIAWVQGVVLFQDQIMIMDADGGNQRPLVTPEDPTETVRDPVFSPDGTKVAYTKSARAEEAPGFPIDGSERVIVADVDGSNPVELISGFSVADWQTVDDTTTTTLDDTTTTTLDDTTTTTLDDTTTTTVDDTTTTTVDDTTTTTVDDTTTTTVDDTTTTTVDDDDRPRDRDPIQRLRQFFRQLLDFLRELFRSFAASTS